MSYAHTGTKIKITEIHKNSPQYLLAGNLLGKEMVLLFEPVQVPTLGTAIGWWVVDGLMNMEPVKISGVRYEVC